METIVRMIIHKSRWGTGEDAHRNTNPEQQMTTLKQKTAPATDRESQSRWCVRGDQ